MAETKDAARVPAERQSRECFVIAPIGDPETPVRKRSDQVIKHVIEPPLREAGYEVVRADKISQPGSITLQIIEKLLKSDIVVADLTEHNPNVFYELGVRHAARKPIVHIIQEGETIPFDVSDFRTIAFNYQDLDSVEAARAQLAEQIAEIERGAPIRTPVKLALLMERETGGEQQNILENLLLGLEDVRRGVKELVAETRRERSLKRVRHLLSLQRAGIMGGAEDKAGGLDTLLRPRPKEPSEPESEG